MTSDATRTDRSSVPPAVSAGNLQSYARTLPPNGIDDAVPSLARVLGAEPGTRVVLGPPGCGKTSRAIAAVDEALAGGVPAHRIAYVAFTRAATQEARTRLAQRVGSAADDLRYVRTVHSLAFRLLRWAPDRLMDGAAWRRFGLRHGYKFSWARESFADEEPFCPSDRTPGDRLRFVLHYGRCRRFALEELIGRRPMAEVRPDEIRLFARRFAAFKAETGLHDFDDLLACALTGGEVPDVEFAVVDEAQDLSPIQVALVERWFRACPRRLIVGDDDQAIYGFNGADPGWLLEQSRVYPTTVLSQSHRVPAAAHALAERIVASNVERAPKVYRPTTEAGELLTLDLDEALRRVDGRSSTFVLARNRRFLVRCAQALRAARVAYVVEGGGAPAVLADPCVAPAVAAAVRLANAGADELIDAADLRALLRLVPADSDLFERGAKAAVDRVRGRVRPSELGLVRLAAAAAREGPTSVLQKLAVEDRRYLQALLRSDGQLPQPNVVLTTIHGAKGREADVVVLLSDLSRSTWERYRADAAGREAEHRVFYVGVTRTRRTLILVRPTTKRGFQFPRVARQGEAS